MSNQSIVSSIEKLLAELDATTDKMVVIANVKEIVDLFRQLQFPDDKQIEMAACTVAFIDPLKDYLTERISDQPTANSRGFVNVGYHALSSIVKTF